MTPDFWMSSGYHLLDPTPEGRLAVTPEFLGAYLGRPEMMPPEEACAAERALHAALLADATRPIVESDLAAMADPDARENYAVYRAFRDLLLESKTVEAAYGALFRPGAPMVPALMIDHLVAVILRHLLAEAGDPFRARAAELFFRSQQVSLQEGAILMADEETVDSWAQGGGLGALGKLVASAGTPLRSIDLDVLTLENQTGYWAASDRHDRVLDFTFARDGQDAFCRAVEAWVLHLLGAAVSVEPVQTIRDERWAWHVGLDAQASLVMNELYEGREVPEAQLARILSLFRLTFRDPSQMLERVAGRPVYLALAMDERNRLRMKPQNLVVNLPLRQRH